MVIPVNFFPPYENVNENNLHFRIGTLASYAVMEYSHNKLGDNHVLRRPLKLPDIEPVPTSLAKNGHDRMCRIYCLYSSQELFYALQKAKERIDHEYRVYKLLWNYNCIGLKRWKYLRTLNKEVPLPPLPTESDYFIENEDGTWELINPSEDYDC